jgi:fructose-bisphosphate aldolase, class II
MLTTSKKLLREAQKYGYAVGQFNIYNLESVQAVIKGAEKEKSPVILGVTEKSIAYAGLSELSLIIKYLAQKTKIPVALHLDHGKTIEIVRKCIKEGFTSVMLDGSFYNLSKNIELTQKAVRIAHQKGVSVEGELGSLIPIDKQEKTSDLTNPKEAYYFAAKTKVDILAIAVGTSHGAYKFVGKPYLDLDRIKLIRDKVKIPLVLHGASGVLPVLVKKANQYGASLKKTSGVSNALVKKAIEKGISKINIDTDLRLAFTSRLHEGLAKNKKEFDPRKILSPAYQEITRIVRAKINLFGSGNKA